MARERPDRDRDGKGLDVLVLPALREMTSLDPKGRPEIIEEDRVEADEGMVGLGLLEVFTPDLPVCEHAEVLLAHLEAVGLHPVDADPIADLQLGTRGQGGQERVRKDVGDSSMIRVRGVEGRDWLEGSRGEGGNGECTCR